MIADFSSILSGHAVLFNQNVVEHRKHSADCVRWWRLERCLAVVVAANATCMTTAARPPSITEIAPVVAAGVLIDNRPRLNLLDYRVARRPSAQVQRTGFTEPRRR